MRARIAVLCVIVIFVGQAFGAGANADEPVFVRWLLADDPGDQTINDYWGRAERGELSAPALVDLGTMLFQRGFKKDALEMFHRALDIDKDFFEAWFRIGLVEHSQGNFDNAEQAYERCLKKRPAHGWCNFYYGLLEEQRGHTTSAMEHYDRALESDAGLGNPKVNPEVLSSNLVLGAQLRNYDRKSFEHDLPMRYLQPNKVRRVYEQYEPVPDSEEVSEVTGQQAPEATVTSNPAPEPTPVPAAPPPRPAPPQRRVVPQRAPVSPTPGTETNEETPYGTAPIGNTSGEAWLIPRWQGAWELAEALV